MDNTAEPGVGDHPETSIERERRVLALIDVVLIDASDEPMEKAIFNALRNMPEDEPLLIIRTKHGELAE